ncbi:SDR family NAD(P)-dependent oxidoreductase [Streptomyces sp. SID3343]|uniref:SDR family NAD(P)-dependent oxidoreductase n=1 Tax=Streptomyces sp. SID3343 TaxID=2690260 RepID=UPI00136EC6A2|nr:SDR family NAD(P)-dependent oxidoreductase [Streptomyces sp. SID3343]MYW01738.1 SDR family NAD(P)-dependent oxidoreductase [Streptomyces sp. SID3343]
MSHGPETTTDELVAGLDLSGRTAVVTGGTSGLGRETVRVLAGAGAHVVLTARDHDKGHEAVADLPGKVDHVVLDLTSLASVRAGAAELTERYPAVDLLINNAGVMATPFGRTADGFETQFGTNHLGHFLLTALLAPTLRAGARVVNLSSAGHVSSGVRWDDPHYESAPEEYHPWKAYGASKTANILFTVELDRRLRAHGVRAYAVHPGMIATNLGRYMTRDAGRDLHKKVTAAHMPAFKSIPAGAATQVWAATAPELADVGGVYLADCAISAEHAPWALDEADAARLWTLSEQWVGEAFPVLPA